MNMLKRWFLKWLGLTATEVPSNGKIPPIPRQAPISANVMSIDWWAHDKKRWVLNQVLRSEWEKVQPKAVARWCIQQFVTCPYCNWETDVIASNLHRKVNQGQTTAQDYHVREAPNGRKMCRLEETEMNIPTPPYFGAMMEDTQNLNEHIPCGACGKDLKVEEVHWQYMD